MTYNPFWKGFLENKYIDVQKNEKLFYEISNNFCKSCNFLNLIGAIDGIQAPPCSGSLYSNYKKNFSIVLMAVL